MIRSEPRRLRAMRRVLLSGDEDDQHAALQELLHFHRHDVAQILRFVDGRPVTLRLLDVPLGELLPDDEMEVIATADDLEVEVDEVERRADVFAERAPELGLRGTRMGLVYPEIYAMQIQAIVEACRMVVDEGTAPTVEVLIPRVVGQREAHQVVEFVEQEVARHLFGASGRIEIDVGVLVQLPRAAMRCGAMALVADFISFDVEELTRLCWGMAKEDSERYMGRYRQEGLVDGDPFATIDRLGVGALIGEAIADGRDTYRDLAVGAQIGGVGDLTAIRHFEALEVDAATVEPSRVVATRLASAQAYVALERARRRRRRRGLEE